MPTTGLKFLTEDKSRVGGYLVVFGDAQTRDLHGEYFTPTTDFCLDMFPVRPMLYHHGLDGKLETNLIGRIDTIKMDDVGLWAEAQLELHNRYVQAIREMIEKGALGWSSGSLPHLVKTERDGWIKCWPIVEGSATPSPAEPRRTDIRVIKSIYKSAGLDTNALQLPDQDLADPPQLLDVSMPDPNAEGTPPETKEPDAKESNALDVPLPMTSVPSLDHLKAALQTTKRPIDGGGMKMNPEMIAALMALMNDMGITIPEDKRDMLTQRIGEMLGNQMSVNEAALAGTYMTEGDKMVNAPAGKAAFTKAYQVAASLVRTGGNTISAGALEAAKGLNGGRGDMPASKIDGIGGGFNTQTGLQITRGSKFDGLSPEDLSYMMTFIGGMASHQNKSYTPSEEIMGAFLHGAQKALERGEQLSPLAHRALKSYKANELNTSTQSGFGDDWVPTLWSDQIWNRVRADNTVAPQIPIIEMTSNPFTLPIETTDPAVYSVPETSDETQLVLSGSGSAIPDSKLGTGNVTLTAAKLALRVGYANEVDEDSLFPFAKQLREKAQRVLQDAIDNVFLNGDNTASGNINLDGGTPGATEKYNVSFKGILFFPITNVATYGINMGGAAPTLAQIRALRAKLPNAYATKINDLVMFCDFPTYMKLLNIPELLTIDKYGQNASVVTGEVGRIDGIRVLITNEMSLAASNGKVSSTSANNTLGRLVIVHRPSFYAGYRRQVKTHVEYLSYYDSYQMTATVRPALVRRDNQCAAVMYNIGV
jgi:HK97 family phage major capsid protein